MVALNSLANIKTAEQNALVNQRDIFYGTKNAVATVANTLLVLDGAGYPTTATAVTFPNVSAEQRHLLSVTAYRNLAYGFAILYDELSVGSTVTINSTGDKTINTPALTRYTDGVDVEAWVTVTTAGTTTAPILTMNSYTDDAGNTAQVGHTSVTFGSATLAANNSYRLPVASGDNGVRAVATINVGTAGGGSAAAKVVLVKPLAIVPLVSALGAPHGNDFVLQRTPMPRIYDGAQLKWAMFCTSTVNVAFDFTIRTIVG